MADKNFLLYGANGYTGQLIAELAIRRGLKPILAGRSEEKLKPLAARFNLPYQVCDLSNKEALNDLVLGVDAVLHCAGPFMYTAEPMVAACLRNKTHYIDITGEISVFEALAAQDRAAKEAGIMLLPGAGFDVVPTDCLAAFLKEKMPSATHLSLAFMNVGGGISHGTAKTMIENMDAGGAIRKNGEIKTVPQAYKTKYVIFNQKPKICVTIPWGDVSTAYHSTGIPNIEVYVAINKGGLGFLKASKYVQRFISTDKAKGFLKKQIERRSAGPSLKKRLKAKSFVWGEVTNKDNLRLEARLQTPEGYTLTALTALTIAQKVLDGNAPIGFQTPSKAYGADFILEMEGVRRW